MKAIDCFNLLKVKVFRAEIFELKLVDAALVAKITQLPLEAARNLVPSTIEQFAVPAVSTV